MRGLVDRRIYRPRIPPRQRRLPGLAVLHYSPPMAPLKVVLV